MFLLYILYRIVFYVPRKRYKNTEEYSIPKGKIYEPYRDVMVNWIKETRTLNYEDCTITSFDGLKLHAKYFEYEKGAPIEIMFHGYRGSAERDLCGAVQRCFSIKRNVLLVDQRTSGESEGNVISFGVNESKDCLAWIDFVVKQFGENTKIILTGISMGASTVIMAAGHPLPKNVVGILADCGYTSAKDIIIKCMKQLHLPSKLLYPLVKKSAKLYGHFNLEESSPIEAIKNCRVPILFFHGESDAFVPCDMSRQNYEACTSPKRLVTVPGAGHGLAYLIDNDGYFKNLCEFFTENGVETSI